MTSIISICNQYPGSTQQQKEYSMGCVMQSGYYRQQGKQVAGFSKKSERNEKSVINHKDQETMTFR